MREYLMAICQKAEERRKRRVLIVKIGAAVCMLGGGVLWIMSMI